MKRWVWEDLGFDPNQRFKSSRWESGRDKEKDEWDFSTKS